MKTENILNANAIYFKLNFSCHLTIFKAEIPSQFQKI